MIGVVKRGMIVEQRILLDRLADVVRDTRHALGFERSTKRVWIRDAQHVKPPRMLTAGGDLWQAQSGDAGQPLMKPQTPASASRNDRIELTKLRDCNGGLQLRHPIVAGEES